jgi:hypothetical protein
MEKSHQQLGSGRRTAKVLVWLMGGMLLILSGCAPGVYRAGEPPRAYPKYFEKPTGPGTIPPSWYEHDPAVGEWFAPWYVNPYQQ